jgi:hypothetical protein
VPGGIEVALRRFDFTSSLFSGVPDCTEVALRRFDFTSSVLSRAAALLFVALTVCEPMLEVLAPMPRVLDLTAGGGQFLTGLAHGGLQRGNLGGRTDPKLVSLTLELLTERGQLPLSLSTCLRRCSLSGLGSGSILSL